MPQKDKIKHLLISFVLAFIIYYLSKNAGLAIILVIAFGLVKELYDYLEKKKQDLADAAADLSADILGGILGMIAAGITLKALDSYFVQLLAANIIGGLVAGITIIIGLKYWKK